jgi:hypothetical protein
MPMNAEREGLGKRLGGFDLARMEPWKSSFA